MQKKKEGSERAPEEQEEEKDGEEEHDCKQATKQSRSYLNVAAVMSVFITAIVVVCVLLNVSPLQLVFGIDSVVEGLHEPVILSNGLAFRNPDPVSIVRVDSQDFRNSFLPMPLPCKSAVEQLLPELFGTEALSFSVCLFALNSPDYFLQVPTQTY